MAVIKNGVNELTLTEQKTILSANNFFIEVIDGKFTGIILTVDKTKINWQPEDINAAIVYCKKNNLIQLV